MEALIITRQLFVDNSPVRSDVVINEFLPYIEIAQKIYIAPLLGYPLYTRLQEDVVAASLPPPQNVPLTPETQALIVKIAPALSFWAVYQGLPFHWASIVGKGLTIRESENSRGVAVDDLAQLRRWLRDDAQLLTKYLTDYLCECQATYPLWVAGDRCGCGCGDKPSSWDAGIWIPKRRRRK